MDNSSTTTMDQPTSTTTTTPSSPATSFPLFRHLPPELRVIIWEICLPSRLIPLSALVIAHKHHYLPPRRSATAAITKLLRSVLGKPCRISQVCRESRAVATARRQPAEELDLEWLTGPGTGGGWFDPRTDTVFVDCDVFDKYTGIWHDVQQALGMTRPAPPGSSSERGCVRVALANELLDWTKPRSDAGSAETGIRQRAWPVVMDKIWLSMSVDTACSKGRFGVFAEECTLLIELCDDTRLEWVDQHRTMPSLKGLDSQTLVQRALKRWEEVENKFRVVSRDVGFAGTEKEWRVANRGPYPVIKLEWMGHLGMC